METGSEQYPDYAAALEAELVVARAERAAALADLAVAKAKEADNQAIILRQKGIHPSRAAGFWAPRVVTSVHGDR
ncbi:hypothetical protein [Rhizobium sp. BK538]|uniref:hypothetical protein n=1 Tax=Rhizobium sp. BK538 TaxID=2586984 RepID=UPI0016147B69|nr:hypothetical protein [Rhizobium sp. BK538]MBB4172085.1 hypothetical protein [Rhizobium sp. BK538]